MGNVSVRFSASWSRCVRPVQRICPLASATSILSVERDASGGNLRTSVTVSALEAVVTICASEDPRTTPAYRGSRSTTVASSRGVES